MDGLYSNWEEWGLCTKTCGDGSQERIRECDNPTPKHNGKDCVGPQNELRPCKDAECPSNSCNHSKFGCQQSVVISKQLMALGLRPVKILLAPEQELVPIHPLSMVAMIALESP